MSNILICGDVHLDTYPTFSDPVDNPISNTRLENILKGIDDFFEYGTKNNIHYYVINGDLFNNRLKMNPSFFFLLCK